MKCLAKPQVLPSQLLPNPEPDSKAERPEWLGFNIGALIIENRF